MSTDQDDQRGDSILARISTEMVRAQKEFFGKGPTQAKSYFFDDMLLVVMHGGLTTAERTMLEFDHSDLVRRFRQVFENEMTERLTGMVEEMTGHTVVNYQSQVMFDPDRIVEMFVFADRVTPEAIRATAQAQLDDEPTGQVPADSPDLDEPSSRGGS